MRTLYRAILANGAIRQAPSGSPVVRRGKEMSDAKKADIEKCLHCQKKKCTGCVCSHEGQYGRRHKKS